MRPTLDWHTRSSCDLPKFSTFGKYVRLMVSWWRLQMETFSALLAICAGNSPVTGEFPAKRPVTQSFDVFSDIRLNKRLSKQSCGCHSGITSWSPWPGFQTAPIKYFHYVSFITLYMMTSSNRNIFRVTGPLWGESIGHRWIPLTGASDAGLWRFLWPAPQQTVEQIIETPVIWDAIALITTSL